MPVHRDAHRPQDDVPGDPGDPGDPEVPDAPRDPDDFVEAYATHCEANMASTPLARTVVAAQALSSLALMPDEERMWVGDFVIRLTPKLDLGFIDSSQAWGFSRRAREEAGILAACLPIAA